MGSREHDPEQELAWGLTHPVCQTHSTWVEWHGGPRLRGEGVKSKCCLGVLPTPRSRAAVEVPRLQEASNRAEEGREVSPPRPHPSTRAPGSHWLLGRLWGVAALTIKESAPASALRGGRDHTFWSTQHPPWLPWEGEPSWAGVIGPRVTAEGVQRAEWRGWGGISRAVGRRKVSALIQVLGGVARFKGKCRSHTCVWAFWRVTEACSLGVLCWAEVNTARPGSQGSWVVAAQVPTGSHPGPFCTQSPSQIRHNVEQGPAGGKGRRCWTRTPEVPGAAQSPERPPPQPAPRWLLPTTCLRLLRLSSKHLLAQPAGRHNSRQVNVQTWISLTLN